MIPPGQGGKPVPSPLLICTAGMIACLIGTVSPAGAQKGKTLFGDNQVETIKAMKKIGLVSRIRG